MMIRHFILEYHYFSELIFCSRVNKKKMEKFCFPSISKRWQYRKITADIFVFFHTTVTILWLRLFKILQ
jgi:hypothetical protein